MLTVADMGEWGVKNHVKSADVLYGWSHEKKSKPFTDRYEHRNIGIHDSTFHH